MRKKTDAYKKNDTHFSLSEKKKKLPASNIEYGREVVLLCATRICSGSPLSIQSTIYSFFLTLSKSGKYGGEKSK